MPCHRVIIVLRTGRNERGGVLVIVAVVMTSAIALVTFVIDVGHWFEHKRHLQLQVDAGALAGGSVFNGSKIGTTSFTGCFSATATERSDPNSAVNQTIEREARRYAGANNYVPPAVAPSLSRLNPQVNNQPNVTVVLNSSAFPNNGGTDNSDPAGPPCQAGYIDVKATEANLPWFFAGSLVPAINAHARVSIQTVATLGGALPLAVRDVNPLDAGALFVNEDAPSFKTSLAAVLGRQQLTAGSTQLLNGVNLVPWTGGPLSITIPTKTPESNTGVVIALCSNPGICGPSKGTAWLSGTVAAVCGQLYVNCFNSDQTGLEFIHGYGTTGVGTASAPIIRDVTLTTGTCTDDSAPYFLLNAGCKLGVQARLDFGTTTDPSKPAAAGGLSATVSVGTCDLSYVSSSGTTSSWSAATCLTIASGAGQVPLTLKWSTGSGPTKVNGSFSPVARPFANDGPTATQSYPIAYAQISKGTGCTGGIGNSVPFGATNFCVGIGVLGNLQAAANTSDPTQVLKFIGANGSHSGAIDCGGTNLYDDIVKGCTVGVGRNPGEACPNATLPVDCMKIRTGQKVGQARQGMNDRFVVNGICPDNNWPLYPAIPQGDPRAVPLIVTLSDAFDGSGSGYVPVTDFAVFYITGWDGASVACNGINQSAPPGAGNGTIWGHFITYTGDLGNSTGGDPCDFTVISLTPCIPVLTE